MIPKIIHYCWFGSNPIPQEHAAYIEDWKCLLSPPGYEFKLWNENNFDINTVPFTAQVAAVKKWGFIVDYIRAWVVFNYGGIYVDTDVEILKPLDDLLDNMCFSGFEDKQYVNPGNIFAGEKGCVIAKELMDFYASYNFINGDGEPNLVPSPRIFTDLLMKYGLKQNGEYQVLKDGIFTAYPVEYFCPMVYKTGKIKMTLNTYSIHHFASSWYSEIDQFFVQRRRIIIGKFGDNILSTGIVIFLNICTRIKKQGLRKGLAYYIRKYLLR
jgi:hypothetical protein